MCDTSVTPYTTFGTSPSCTHVFLSNVTLTSVTHSGVKLRFLVKRSTLHLTLNNRRHWQRTFKLPRRRTPRILMISQSSGKFMKHFFLWDCHISEKNHALCATLWNEQPCAACFALFFWQLRERSVFSGGCFTLFFFLFFSFKVKRLGKQKEDKQNKMMILAFISYYFQPPLRFYPPPVFIFSTSLWLFVRTER